MFICEMSGCFDTAELTAEFTHNYKEGKETEIFEICESCARYWLEQPAANQPKITRHKPRKLFAMTALEERTPETKSRLVLDLCDYCPTRYPATVKFVQVFDKWQVSHWLEPVNPLAGSDWLATWCENCGPQHQNELNIRAWKEKKNQTATERETKQNA
jgi:hypothetical protein